MMRKWMVAGAGFLLMTLLASAGVSAAWAAPQAPAGPQEKPAYTMAEYNAYQAAANEKNPAQRVKLLEDFVAKYPSSTLLIYAYDALWGNYYNDLRNFPKTIENIDRLLTFGDKIDLTSRLRAQYYRASAFHASFSDKAPDAKTQAAAARDAAQKGIQMLGQWTKPEGATDEQYAESKKLFAALFNYTVGFAAMQGKDCKGAVDGFKAALAIDATAGLTWFRLGVTYLLGQQPYTITAVSRTSNVVTVTLASGSCAPIWQVGQEIIIGGMTDATFNGRFAIASVGSATSFAYAQTAANGSSSGGTASLDPPQYMDGFWALARSIALKGPSEAQVRDYLRKQLQRYQQTGCDKLLTDQMNELLSLAAASTDRPTTYKIPSAAELDAARQNMTIISLIADLKGSGERAKLVWLAACGLEFPDVPAKVIQATSGDAIVTLKLFTGATSEEIEVGTTANLEVRIEGQPEARRIKKDDLLRFTGTLADYTPDPFLLRWEKAKANPEDIPEEKAAPGKKAPTKRPPKKPPSR